MGSLFSGMVITDLDGTLLNSTNALSPGNRKSLEDLGTRGVCRVVATGRNLHSARKVLPADLPIDFLIFSCGAGILNWRSGELLRSESLDQAGIDTLCQHLNQLDLSYMVHLPVPENHRFFAREGKQVPADFQRRMERLKEFEQPTLPSAASQLLAVCEAQVTEAVLAEIKSWQRGYSIVRTTSPLDHVSTWIEIFRQGVHKGSACDWLLGNLSLDPQRTLAVGNDYNDEEMLDWAREKFMVKNAPEELKRRYPTVNHHDQDGFAEAVRLWLPAA